MGIGARFHLFRFSRNCLEDLRKKSRRWFDAWFRTSLYFLVEYLGRFLFGNSLKNALQRAPMPTAPPCSDGVLPNCKESCWSAGHNATVSFFWRYSTSKKFPGIQGPVEHLPTADSRETFRKARSTRAFRKKETPKRALMKNRACASKSASGILTSVGEEKSPRHWPSCHAPGFEVSLRRQNPAQRQVALLRLRRKRGCRCRWVRASSRAPLRIRGRRSQRGGRPLRGLPR